MKLSRILLTAFALMASIPTFSSCSSDNDDNGTDVELKVSKSSLDFQQAGGSAQLAVQAGTEPTLVSDQDWCTYKLESSSTTIYKYTITVEANPETSDRTATLSVKCGGESCSVAINQTAHDGLSVSPASYDISAADTTMTVQVSANGDFSVASEAAWISVVDSDVRGNMTKSEVVLSVAANPSASARSGKVVFTLGALSDTVIVNQAGNVQTGKTYTAMQIAAQMCPGWNLGNTMEGANVDANGNVTSQGETSWQSTVTTQAFINFVAENGYKSIRIPCNWYSHADADHKIDAAWMKRVQEIVDYSLSAGLYVLLNDHYDINWLQNSMATYDIDKAAILKNLWTQIATHFAGYDQRLLFAGLNEPAADTQAKSDNLTRYEQDFIDAVRATGGNNASRILVVQGPNTDIDVTDKYYSLPNDPADNALAVEVHYYSPWYTCGLEADANWSPVRIYWGAANHSTTFTDRNCESKYEEAYVASQFKKMQSKFCAKGIPVMLGEYGINWFNNVSTYNWAKDGTTGKSQPTDQDKHNASVKLFHKTVVAEAINHGCVPFTWDTNYTGSCTMTIFNRNNGGSIFNAYAMDGVNEGASAGKWPY